MGNEENPRSSSYKHSQKSVQRPDVGVEAQFGNKKIPKSYRYDSSLAPELCWDENGERDFAEWLLNLVAEAAEKGEGVVFTKPQEWKGTNERFSSLAQCAARLKSLTKPFLNWAGKAERQQISVPTLPLFVHERHSTQAILETLKAHKALGANLDLFGDPQLDVAEKLDAYQHKGPWTNRLVLGDSLQVMNSLLEYEGMGGQMQMIYFDPPYGVKFGSNFQPFVRKRDVTHGKDDEMIREPEMVKAYRDTWELGLHSYLTYLRDRLLLARELLTESGSIFVQISDENLHHVRESMDEVFGAENFVALINFTTTGGQATKLLSQSCDFLLWYAKNKDIVKYSQLYESKISENDVGRYEWIESHDGFEIRKLSREELENPSLIPDGWKLLVHDNITSQGSTETSSGAYTWNDQEYFPPKNSHWKTKPSGLDRLAKNNRLMAIGSTLRYKRYLLDFPISPIQSGWNDTAASGFGRKKEYVVETNIKVIQRCLLMTTDPGDLVLDITCGSGTTAYAQRSPHF